MPQPPLTANSESPHRQRLGIAAAEELRQAVRSQLTELFTNFVRQLPPALTAAAAKVTIVKDKTALQELARTVTSNTSRWVETFIQHVDAHLIAGTLPPRTGAEVDSAAADAMQIANIELRAEGRYQKLVMELDARVNRLRLMLYVPVYTKALAPTGMSRSLQDTADAMGWPVHQRALLFDKFDTVAIPSLERLYRSMIDTLTRIGNAALSSAVAEPEVRGAVPSRPPPRPKKSATAMAPPPDPQKVDPETLSMLQSFALKSDGVGYTDGLLAADLLALADQRPLPGVEKDQSWVPLQRIGLAGHFLNEAIADPMVPEEFVPQHEQVRLPLVKSALSDESLFTAATSHPLGSLVHEMLLKSAASRVTGNTETRRVADLLQEVLVQFNLAPEFVRLAMRNAQAIPETQIQRFFELQRGQAQQRREFVIMEAKRMVIRQIEQYTFGRATPEPAMKFLNLAWGPLLTKRLLQHGADHPLSKAGVALMDQLLDQLDIRLPNETPQSDWLELMQTMSKALVAEGMAAEKVNVALASLEAARKTPLSTLGFG
jgi:hypothetical protein